MTEINKNTRLCEEFNAETNSYRQCIDNGKLCIECSVYAGNAKLPNQFRSK